jgi:hypothetical protein
MSGVTDGRNKGETRGRTEKTEEKNKRCNGEPHRAAVCGHSDGALAGDAIRSPRNEFITL